jgi:hypothetical protein
LAHLPLKHAASYDLDQPPRTWLVIFYRLTRDLLPLDLLSLSANLLYNLDLPPLGCFLLAYLNTQPPTTRTNHEVVIYLLFCHSTRDHLLLGPTMR